MSAKILIATFGFYPETHGIAQVAYRQAIGMHLLGYDVTVVTRSFPRSYKLPFKVITYPVPSRRFPRLFQHKAAKAYQRFLLDSDFDVLFFHCWETWVSELAIPLLGQIKGKTVLISHGTTTHLRYPGFKGWLRWLLHRPAAWGFSKKLTCFDHYVFLSNQSDKQRMWDVMEAKRLGITNFTIIPNGAHPAFSDPATVDFRAKYNIQSTHLLLCVGNFIREKGQLELLQWFSELSLEDTALVLIGSRFNAYSATLKRAIGTQRHKTVYLLEQLPTKEIRAAYDAATLFVSATYTEVQPLVLIDAMAVGLPFLCRKTGTVPAMDGGICFQSKKEFQAKLQWLLRNPLILKSLSNKGKLAVQQTYHWEIPLQSHHKLIQKLIAP